MGAGFRPQAGIPNLTAQPGVAPLHTRKRWPAPGHLFVLPLDALVGYRCRACPKIRGAGRSVYPLVPPNIERSTPPKSAGRAGVPSESVRSIDTHPQLRHADRVIPVPAMTASSN